MPEEGEASSAQRVLRDIGYLSSFLHQHAGGRSGKPHVLTKLLRHDGHLTQRELQAYVPTSPATLSEILSKLEAKGLIERTPLESDRRQLDVRLTEAGRERARDMEEHKREFEQDCLSVLDLDERQQLIGLLDRVVAHWKTMEEREKATTHEH
jgi:DNA-binding MarR family transcriptional regulator